MQYLEIAGGYPKSSYRHQAQYIIRLLADHGGGHDYMLQYDFMNDGSNRSYTEHNFGLVHEDYSPKPSLMAIAFLTRTLEHASLVKDLSTRQPNIACTNSKPRTEKQSSLATHWRKQSRSQSR